MIKELSNGYYIDAWWDRFSRNYIVQVKDNEGYEIECEYCGNKGDRDSIIQYLTDEYMKGNLTEDIEDVLEIGTHVQVNPDVKSKVSGEFGVIKGIDDNKYMIEFDVMPGSTVSFSRHELVVMDDDEELLEEKLFSKKKKKLPALDTLRPLEIIPDAAAGIDSFNNNNNVNNSEGSSSEAMGEALRVNNVNDKTYVAPKGKTLSWYKNEIKKHKPDYNFNRLNKVEASRKPYVAYMILDRILKQEELDNAQIDMANDHKNMANNYSDDNDVNYDGDSFFKSGIEFESEEAAREYFREGKIMPNKESEKYYWNIMHEAYDIVEENVPKRKLNESLAKRKKVSLKECLKNRDREDFDKLSECYELEMFYEAVEKDLSKEDVEAIKNYANDKRNSSEEVAAYIKGKLDEEIEGGSFKARLNNVKMMHEVMRSMNNENAYGSWIYTMPDCPDESDFEWFAEEKEEYKDLVDTFNRIYNRYKKDGLYKPSEEVLDFLNYSGYGDVEVFESLTEAKRLDRSTLSSVAVKDVRRAKEAILSYRNRLQKLGYQNSVINKEMLKYSDGGNYADLEESLNESSDGWFEADWEILKNSLSPEAYNLLDDITSSNMSQVYTNSTGQYKYGDEYDDYVFDSLGELENSLRYDLDQGEELGLGESLNEAMNYVSLADLIDWVSEHGQAACDIERYYNKYLDDMNTDEILDWIYDHEQLAKDYENHFGSLNESYATSDSDNLILSLCDECASVEEVLDRLSELAENDDPTALEAYSTLINICDSQDLGVENYGFYGDKEATISDIQKWYNSNVESLNEEIEPNKEAVIEEINNLILRCGFELDSNIRHENPAVGFNGSSMHWQVVRKDYEFTSADGQDGLRELAAPLVQSLDAFEDQHGNDFAVTWNFGVDRENHVTCGFDVRSANRGFFN